MNVPENRISVRPDERGPAAIAPGHDYLPVAYTGNGGEKTCLVARTYPAMNSIADFLAGIRASPVVLDHRLSNDPELRYALDRYGLSVALAPPKLPDAIIAATRRLGPAQYQLARLLRRMAAQRLLRNLLMRTIPGSHIDPQAMQLHLLPREPGA